MAILFNYLPLGELTKVHMTEPTSALLGGVIWKYGLLKILALGSALMGAGIMAIFRPPATRKELFLQGAVALGASLMFGGFAVNVLSTHTALITIATASLDAIIQFNVAVYGLIGAMSWGIFGGLSVLRDKVGKDPISTIKEVKDLV